MIICTIYSHETGFEKITEVLQKAYPQGSLTVSTHDEMQVAEMSIKASLLGSPKKIKITYRQRNIPSYLLPETDDSPLTTNLKGLHGYVNSLPTANEKIKERFLHKIHTLNSEFSIDEQGKIKDMKTLIETLAREFDAVLFVQPGTIISKSDGQHFLDHDLNLIIDNQGRCEIDHLKVETKAVYFDGPATEPTADQAERKAESEKFLEQWNIKINKHLPYIESEAETTIRSAKEIAQRVTVLAVTNAVAFGNISAKNATEYLQHYDLWNFVTPKEKDFLNNPTEEKKMHETWKCEGIWTLMWALGKVDALGSPDELCSLDNVPKQDYPVGQGKNPNDFIQSITDTRTKAEIMDAADIYYRIDWACVDARINQQQVEGANPEVVYERHYALNWLINYGNQEWDHVSCDT